MTDGLPDDKAMQELYAKLEVLFEGLSVSTVITVLSDLQFQTHLRRHELYRQEIALAQARAGIG